MSTSYPPRPPTTSTARLGDNNNRPQAEPQKSISPQVAPASPFPSGFTDPLPPPLHISPHLNPKNSSGHAGHQQHHSSNSSSYVGDQGAKLIPPPPPPSLSRSLPLPPPPPLPTAFNASATPSLSPPSSDKDRIAPQQMRSAQSIASLSVSVPLTQQFSAQNRAPLLSTASTFLSDPAPANSPWSPLQGTPRSIPATTCRISSSVSPALPLPPPPPPYPSLPQPLSQPASSLSRTLSVNSVVSSDDGGPGSGPRSISKRSPRHHHVANTPTTKGKKRIDPASLPRPVKLQSDIVFHTRSGSVRCIPPLASSGYVTVDTGNCSPRHMRITMCAPPASSTIQKRLGIPFALNCTPFAEPESEEIDVPVCNFGRQLPPRCGKCGGYVNNNCLWLDGGNVWACNLCEHKNTVEPWYFCSLDGSGNRLDRKDRPELVYGSYDIELPSDRDVLSSIGLTPVPSPVYIFAIDASSRSINNQSLPVICTAIKQSLRSLPGIELGARVGVLTFGQDINFYQLILKSESVVGDAGSSIDSCLDAADPTQGHKVQMHAIDADDPFASVPVDRWLLPVRINSQDGSMQGGRKDDNVAILEALLDMIPLLHQPRTSSTNVSNLRANGSAVDLSQYPSASNPSFSPNSRANNKNSSNNDEQVANCPFAALLLIAEVIQANQARLSPSPPTISTATAAASAMSHVRVYLFSTSASTVGAGRYRKREALGIYGTAAERVLYSRLDTVLDMTPTSAARSPTSVSSSKGLALGLGLSLGSSVDDDGAGYASMTSNSSGPRLHLPPSSSSSYSNNSHNSNNSNSSSNNSSTPLMFFKELSNSFVSTNSVVNMVLIPPRDQFVDITLLSECCDATGGLCQIFYGSLTKEEHCMRLQQQIRNLLLAPYSFDVTMKLRMTSKAIQLKSVLGTGKFDAIEETYHHNNMFAESSHSIMLVNHNSASQQLAEDEKIHLQYAVMYSTPYKRQLIRIHNLTVYASQSEVTIFKNVDPCAVFGVLARATALNCLSHPLNDPRTHLYELCLQLLYNYRVLCSAHSPKNHLILPESLRLLPLYAYAILKHPSAVDNNANNLNAIYAAATSLKGTNSNSSTSSSSLAAAEGSGSGSGKAAGSTPTSGNDIIVRAQDRAVMLRRLCSLPLNRTMDSLFPRLFVLHVMLDDEEFDDLLEVDIDAIYADSPARFHPYHQQQQQQQQLQSQQLPSQLVMQSVPYRNPSPSSLSLLSVASSPAAITTGKPHQHQYQHQYPYQYQSPTAASHLIFKLPRLQCCSVEVLESEGVYLLQDDTRLWLLIGRNVPEANLVEWFGLKTGERPKHISFTNTRNAQILKKSVDIVKATADIPLELIVVWGDCNTSELYNDFYFRCVESSFRGEDDYNDFLYKMHSTISKSL